MFGIVEVLDVERAVSADGEIRDGDNLDIVELDPVVTGVGDLLDDLVDNLLGHPVVPVLLPSTECHHKLACPPEEP